MPNIRELTRIKRIKSVREAIDNINKEGHIDVDWKKFEKAIAGEYGVTVRVAREYISVAKELKQPSNLELEDKE